MPKLKNDVFSLVRTDHKFGSAGDEITIIRQLDHGAIVQVTRTGNRFSCTHDDIDYGLGQQTNPLPDVAAQALRRSAPDDKGPDQAPVKKTKKKPLPPAQTGMF